MGKIRIKIVRKFEAVALDLNNDLGWGFVGVFICTIEAAAPAAWYLVCGDCSEYVINIYATVPVNRMQLGVTKDIPQ